VALAQDVYISFRMSKAERIDEALKAAGMGGIFVVKTNAQHQKLVDLIHNKKRASPNHEAEDVSKAVRALKDAGFEAYESRWTITVREAAKRAKVNYEAEEAHDARYLGAYDIEVRDCY